MSYMPTNHPKIISTMVFGKIYQVFCKLQANPRNSPSTTQQPRKIICNIHPQYVMMAPLLGVQNCPGRATTLHNMQRHFA